MSTNNNSGSGKAEQPRISENDLTILQNLRRHGQKVEMIAFLDQLAIRYNFNPEQVGINVADGTFRKIPEGEKS